VSISRDKPKPLSSDNRPGAVNNVAGGKLSFPSSSPSPSPSSSIDAPHRAPPRRTAWGRSHPSDSKATPPPFLSPQRVLQTRKTRQPWAVCSCLLTVGRVWRPPPFFFFLPLPPLPPSPLTRASGLANHKEESQARHRQILPSSLFSQVRTDAPPSHDRKRRPAARHAFFFSFPFSLAREMPRLKNGG